MEEVETMGTIAEQTERTKDPAIFTVELEAAGPNRGAVARILVETGAVSEDMSVFEYLASLPLCVDCELTEIKACALKGRLEALGARAVVLVDTPRWQRITGPRGDA